MAVSVMQGMRLLGMCCGRYLLIREFRLRRVNQPVEIFRCANLRETRNEWFCVLEITAQFVSHKSGQNGSDTPAQSWYMLRNINLPDTPTCVHGPSRNIHISTPSITSCPQTTVLRASTLSQAIDVWSVGCIFAELLLRKPLFPGTDCINQLKIICEKLGKPDMNDLDFVTTEKVNLSRNVRDTRGNPQKDIVTYLVMIDFRSASKRPVSPSFRVLLNVRYPLGRG